MEPYSAVHVLASWSSATGSIRESKGDHVSPRFNALLADLPEAEFNTLTQHMDLVSLKKGQTLFHRGQVPKFVYFPVGAIVSMLNDMIDGYSVETFMLGRACLVGVGTLGEPSFYRAEVRNAGLAYRMTSSALIRERAQCPVYMRTAFAATNRMLMQLSQVIACGKRHPIDQQLIRWILITLDRTLTSTISCTHQEIADLLGFRREAITLALQKIAENDSISTNRGKIEVIDRDVLESLACECYWIGQQRKKPKTLGSSHRDH